MQVDKKDKVDGLCVASNYMIECSYNTIDNSKTITFIYRKITYGNNMVNYLDSREVYITPTNKYSPSSVRK